MEKEKGSIVAVRQTGREKERGSVVVEQVVHVHVHARGGGSC